MAQVSEDKIAVFYRKKVCIYNIADGRELFSKELKKPADLICIKNKYVLVYFLARTQQEYKILAIDINDYSANKEINIEYKVHSAIYLKRGLMVVGGNKITVWRAGKCSFELAKSEEPFKEPVKSLLALTDDTFASASEQKVCIWNSDLKLLHELDADKRLVELKAFQNDVLIVYTVADFYRWNGKVWMYNFKSGELLKKISLDFPLNYLFLTPDRSFLVIVGEKKIAFYHSDMFIMNVIWMIATNFQVSLLIYGKIADLRAR